MGIVERESVEAQVSTSGPVSGPAPSRPLVVTLGDPAVVDPALAGGKAAALAQAGRAGLSILPGTVLTTTFTAEIDAGTVLEAHPALAEAFELAGGHHQALVARSSSVLEDTAGSSMAGQFDSVIGVAGFPAFVAAVDRCWRHGPGPEQPAHPWPCSSSRCSNRSWAECSSASIPSPAAATARW